MIRSLPKQIPQSADGFISSSAFEMLNTHICYKKNNLWLVHLLSDHKQIAPEVHWEADQVLPFQEVVVHLFGPCLKNMCTCIHVVSE